MLAVLICTITVSAIAPSAFACDPQAPCSAVRADAVPASDSPRKGLDPQRLDQHHLVLAVATAKQDQFMVIPAAARAKPADPSQVEMPWIWKALKKSAYDRLPQKRIDGVHCTFAPTIVSSGFDTVAGAGVQGRF